MAHLALKKLCCRDWKTRSTSPLTKPDVFTSAIWANRIRSKYMMRTENSHMRLGIKAYPRLDLTTKNRCANRQASRLTIVDKFGWRNTATNPSALVSGNETAPSFARFTDRPNMAGAARWIQKLHCIII